MDLQLDASASFYPPMKPFLLSPLRLVTSMKQPIKPDSLYSGLSLMGAVYFVFRS